MTRQNDTDWTPTVESTLDTDTPGSVTSQIVALVCDDAGIDLHDADTPLLYDTIDPESIDRLIGHDATIAFEYVDRLVEVDGDGSVTVFRQGYDPAPGPE